MAAPPKDALMTIKEFAALADDDLTHELVDGRVVSGPKPGYRHGALQMRLGVLLSAHLEREGIAGEVVGESGFRTAPGAQTVRAPDVCFVAGEPDDDPGFPAGAPDLVIEITSPSDRHTEVQEKALMWLAAGSRLVLVVDPEARSVTAYRAADDIRVHRADEAVDASDVVAGWRLPLAELFRR